MKTKIRQKNSNYVSVVETLRKKGIKVAVRHFRWVKVLQINALIDHTSKDRGLSNLFLAHVTQKNRKDFQLIHSNGGKTIVRITFQDGKDYEIASLCSPGDTFAKRLGVQIAINRINHWRHTGIAPEPNVDVIPPAPKCK